MNYKIRIVPGNFWKLFRIFEKKVRENCRKNCEKNKLGLLKFWLNFQEIFQKKIVKYQKKSGKV